MSEKNHSNTKIFTDLNKIKNYTTKNQKTTFSGKTEVYFERDASAGFFCGFTVG